MGNGAYMLCGVGLGLAYLYGKRSGRADAGNANVSWFHLFRASVLFLLWPLRLVWGACLWYRDARQRARLSTVALPAPVPMVDVTPEPDRSVVKQLCPGVVVRFAINSYDVIPTMVVTSASLAAKLGGHELQLRGYSKGAELDLAVFNDIVVRVSDQVSGLLASLDHQIEAEAISEQVVQEEVQERFDLDPQRVVVKDICAGVQVKLLKYPRHIVPQLCTTLPSLAEKLGGDVLSWDPLPFPVFDLVALSEICFDVTKQASELLGTLGFHVQPNHDDAVADSEVPPAFVRPEDEQPFRVLWKDVCKGARLKLNVFSGCVEPELHVSTEKLKHKLGGEVLALPAVAFEKFELASLSDIMLSVAAQVVALVTSLDETTAPAVVSKSVPATVAKSTGVVADTKGDAPEQPQKQGASPADSSKPTQADSAEPAFGSSQASPTATDNFVEGKLESFGLDKRTLNDVKDGPKKRDCFFADVRISTGQVVRKWGVDLERGISVANVGIGDRISITFTGKVGRKNTYVVRRV